MNPNVDIPALILLVLVIISMLVVVFVDKEPKSTILKNMEDKLSGNREKD